MGKNLPASGRSWFHSSVWKISWRREWLPTPVFLPGEFHGQGSKESDTSEVTEHTHADSFTDVEDRIKFLPPGKESKEQSRRPEENGLNHSFPSTLQLSRSSFYLTER